MQYEQIKHCENDEDKLKQIINETSGIKIKDLKLMDLIFYNDQPIYRGVGVYVFKSSERIYYVGSCISRSFVERIPGHFDIRQGGWFNSLLKAIVKRDNNIVNDDSLADAARYVNENLSLILINFDSKEDQYINLRITNLERKLGKVIDPLNSSFRRYREIPNEIISDL